MENNGKPLIYQRPGAVSVLALFCCLMWGSAFPFIKMGYEMMDINDAGSQLIYGGLRFLLAGFLTLAFASISRKKLVRIEKSSLPAICGQGLLQTTAQYVFYYIGLAHCSSTKSAVINASYTFFAIIIAHFLIKDEKLNWRKTLGCILGFGGIVVMNMKGSGLGGEVSLIGEGFILIGSIAYGASSVTLKLLTRREDAAVLTGAQLVFGSLIMLLIGFAMGGRLSGWTAASLLLLLYLAAVSSVAFTLWSLLLKYNPVSRVTIFGFSIPVFGMCYSAVLLNERAFTMQNLVALVLVCVGIIIVNRRPGAAAGSGKQ